MKSLYAAAFVCVISACGVSQVQTNSDSNLRGVSSAQLATSNCFEQVFGKIDRRTGTVDGKQIDCEQIQRELEECFKNAGIPTEPDEPDAPGQPGEDPADPGQPGQDPADPGQPGGGSSSSSSCQTSVSNGVCTSTSCVDGKCTTNTSDVSGGGSCECKSSSGNGGEVDPSEQPDPSEAGGAQGQKGGSSCNTSVQNNVCTIKSCVNGNCTTSTVDTSKGQKCECKNGGNGGGGGGGGGQVPDYSGVGKPCPADGNCGKNLTCRNPLKEKLPSNFARCAPAR